MKAQRPRWTRRPVKKTGRQSTRKFQNRQYSSLKKEHIRKNKRRDWEDWE